MRPLFVLTQSQARPGTVPACHLKRPRIRSGTGSIEDMVVKRMKLRLSHGFCRPENRRFDPPGEAAKSSRTETAIGRIKGRVEGFMAFCVFSINKSNGP